MTLDDLLRLAAEATPGPLTVRRYDHGGGRFSASDAAGYDRNLVADFYHEGDRELFAAFSPEVAAALVKVAMALPQALDRMQTAWDLLHPGDLTDDERDGIAQALWFGIEEGDPLVDALDAVLAARP